MRHQDAKRISSLSSSGFSFTELVVVAALFGLLAMISAPELLRYIRRSRQEGIARQTAALLQRAKMESVRMSAPVVVRLDYDTDEVIAFADLNDEDGDPVSNLLFDPVEGAPQRTTDFEIGRVRLPSGVFFWGAGDPAPEGEQAVAGFTAVAGQTPNAAILQSNGTVRDAGAFRFGDERTNYLEVFVSPAATAKIQLRKHQPDREDPPDDTYYFPPGEGDSRWIWFD
jgi:prepilin-type N-terminal cleavage/methylation domain-containing protein